MMTRAKRQQQAVMDKLGKPMDLELQGGCKVHAPGLQAYLLATHNAMNLHSADIAALAVALNDQTFPATLAALCQAVPANDEDPITSEVPEPPLFYKGPHQFSAKALADYFKSTGKTTNPFTNVELDPLEITALGAIVDDATLAASILQKKQELEEHAAREGVLDVLSNDFAVSIDNAIQMAIEQGMTNVGDLLDVSTALFDAGGFERWDAASARALQRLDEVSIQLVWEEYLCIEHIRVVIDALSIVFDELPVNAPRQVRFMRFLMERHELIQERQLY